MTGQEDMFKVFYLSNKSLICVCEVEMDNEKPAWSSTLGVTSVLANVSEKYLPSPQYLSGTNFFKTLSPSSVIMYP